MQQSLTQWILAPPLLANGDTGSKFFLRIARAQDQAITAVRVINAATAESQNGPAHGLDGRVPSQNDEITPREGGAVLFLDGLQESERVVQIGVIWPIQLGVKPEVKIMIDIHTNTITKPSGKGG
jgi:hypothetical protein